MVLYQFIVCVSVCVHTLMRCAVLGSAESYLNECYANCSAIHGPHHPRSLLVQDELARLLIRTDRHEVRHGLPPLTLPSLSLPLSPSLSLSLQFLC